MADSFDPYHKWLAIPPAEQPANHYRLLGLALFEDDLDTISIAADRQMTHVRTFQTGPHSALSQKLLNELAAARLCLLEPGRKTAYDAELKAELAGSDLEAPTVEINDQRTISTKSGQSFVRPMPKAKPLVEEGRTPTSAPSVVTDVASRMRSRQPTRPAWVLPAAGAGGLLVLLLGAWAVIRFNRPTRPDALPQPRQAVAEGSSPEAAGITTGEPAKTPKGIASRIPQADATSASTSSSKPGLTIPDAAPSVPGVTADRIVLWNTHNDVHKDRGTRECRLILLRNGDVVWRQDDIEIPWSPEEDEHVSLDIPQIQFDRVRVEITKFEGVGSGLAEIEVFRGDRNLARGCPAAAVCILDPRFPASKVTDGITTSFYNGYWVSHDLGGWIEVDLAFADSRPCQGVLADKLVVWNSHNPHHNDRGSLNISAKLLLGDQEVWRQDDLAISWRPNEDGKLEVPLPPQQRFDRVRIDVNSFTKIGGSLAEVQVFQGRHNLAASCPVQANGCLNHFFRPEVVTDGITTSLQEGRGYWCSYDHTGGWVEIDLSCNCQEIGSQNKALGSYRALAERDWLRGLPWLARSDAAELRRLALLDASETTEPTELTLIGDGWWDFAPNSPAGAKEALLTRSLFSYGRALPRLGEFERDRFRQRVRETLPLEQGAYLCFLEPSTIEQVWPENNIYAMPAVVNSVRYPFGIWTHPSDVNLATRIVFNVEKKYGGFHGAAALNDSSQGKNTSALTFEILGDQRLLWSSQPIQATSQAELFDIDVSGVDELVLQVNQPADFGWCHAVWLDPRLELAPPTPGQIRGAKVSQPRIPLAANTQEPDASSTDVAPADSKAMPAKPAAESPQPEKPALGDLARRAEVKLAVPDEDSLREAARTLRQRFRSQWSGGKESAAKLAAAQALAEYGRKRLENPAERFVLWEQVRELSSSAGELDLACEAVETICGEFDRDANDLKQECLATASKVVSSVDQAATLLDAAAVMILEAVAADNHPVAKKLVTTAQTITKKVKDPVQIKTWANHGRELADIATEFEKAQAAKERLAQDDNDADANFAVGHYDASIKGDWSSGLPKLAKGEDPVWQMLAQDDLAHAAPTDPMSLTRAMQLADGWWGLAEKATWLPQYHLRRRAIALYKKALPAAGLEERSKIEQRLIELLGQDDGLPKWDLFDDSQTQHHGSFVRINPNQGMSTLAMYRGPIDVTLVARTDSTNIRLHAFVGGGVIPGVIWNWELNQRELRVQHVGGGVGTAQVKPLEVNRWYALRYVVTDRDVTVTVDGVPVFKELHATPQFHPSTITVTGAFGSLVDVRKMIVRPVQ